LSFVDNEIVVGDKYSLVYTPNVGTSLYINNKKKGTIKGLLANDSVDNDLRDELLNI